MRFGGKSTNRTRAVSTFEGFMGAGVLTFLSWMIGSDDKLRIWMANNLDICRKEAVI